MRKYLVACGIVFLLCGVGFAGGVPLVTPADFADTSPSAHWFWTLLAHEIVGKLWLWVTTTVVGIVVGWLKWTGTRKEKAIACLAAGVRETYEHYVRLIKIHSADGKLTEQERDEACRQAIAHGTKFAKAQGIDLAKVLVKESLPMLVDWLVHKAKWESAVAKNPLAASPDRSSALAPLPQSAY